MVSITRFVYIIVFYNLALIIDYSVFFGHFLIQLFFLYITEIILMQSFCFLSEYKKQVQVHNGSPKFAAQNLMKLKPNWRLRILALRHKNHKSKISHAQSPDSLIRFVFDDSVNNHPLCNCHRKYFQKPFFRLFGHPISKYVLFEP